MIKKYAFCQHTVLNIVLFLALSVSTLGCGTTSTSIPSPVSKPPPTVKLSVSNLTSPDGTAASALEGESVAIIVDVEPYEHLGWTWQVSGTSGGALNTDEGENVVYTAGKAGIDTITIRATLADGTPLKESLTIQVEAAATEIPVETDNPLPPRVTLDNLQNNQHVPCENLARGTYPDDLEDAIWPVVFISGRYYPQDDGGKAAQKANGEWYQNVRFGDCTNNPEVDSGKAFQLIILTANEATNLEFENYFSNGRKTGQWPGMKELPAGAEEQVRIIVIRE
jgi:hypothetical protein